MYFGVLTRNPILDCAILAWFIAQLIKTLVDLVILKTFSLRRMVSSGGMPSSHSAFTVAGATAIGKLYGTGGPAFALAAIFAIVVMYDACNVRRSAGDTARLVNLLLASVEKVTREEFSERLREVMGHTPLQVLVGALLGLALGMLV